MEIFFQRKSTCSLSPIENAKQGSSCEVCQQPIGEWGHYLVSSPMWKLLSNEMCHINIANICLHTTLSLVNRSAASQRSPIVMTSIFQPIRFNLNRIEMIRHRANRTDTGQRGGESEGDGQQRVMEKEPKHKDSLRGKQKWEAEGRGEGGVDNFVFGNWGLKTLGEEDIALCLNSKSVL